MHRSFNIDENFLRKVTLLITPRRNLGFLRPLIRQEVIKIKTSNFEHSSFTTVEIFFPLVGVFTPPRNVKTMANRRLYSY